MTVTSSTTVERRKLQGYDFYREVLGSPKYIGAPMVDQSELAWRKLSRRYGVQVAYTPMINAKMFSMNNRKPYRELAFNTVLGEEGGPGDRPLIVQFCANDPEQLLTSAKVLESHCDAIDINLGCPQDIAKKGRYGSFLQDEWDLIFKMINTLHENLSIPVTAKFRVFPSLEKTVEYAKMLERAGAQILTCHGRTREQRGHHSGLADWAKIRAVKEAVKVPVFANGNILFHSDIARCLEETGADGVMSAEGQLYNAALFAPAIPLTLHTSEPESSDSPPSAEPSPSSPSSPPVFDTGLHPIHTTLAFQYLDIVKTQKTPTAPSAIKGHLFKILRPALNREKDLRERLGRIIGKDQFSVYHAIVEELHVRMVRDVKEALGEALGERYLKIQSGEAGTGIESLNDDDLRILGDLVATDASTSLKTLPHWVAQPYFRPPPKPAAIPTEEQNLETPVEDPTMVLGSQAADDNRAAPIKRPHSERTPEGDGAKGVEDLKRMKLDLDDSVEGLVGTGGVVCG
ncbi:Dus-domain-containing protein [Stereum hirsutum FP-91666 SS1]|uniref:tRNA-dihydrouridine(16/17) synthase [NAD(P)(+)] n=1 Tax=Stereum hirsutum (strain FP-91666) TaxID=721885 RepID=R7RYR4_STEHR|nr:Dus-domain-containing protein [Stereum hirsutum FP-91666 SS1]EIM80469.1 Dus-domain-containing protein [Stereum hirsutum FP-91666 SS1]